MNEHGKRIKEAMRKGVTQVVFRKANGELRTMLGTVNPDLIPEDKLPKGTQSPSQNEQDFELIKCYDVEADGWRSFNVCTVEEYNDDVNGAVVICA